jgi:hypothetical protein
MYQIQVDNDNMFGSPEVDDNAADPVSACDPTTCSYPVNYGGALNAAAECQNQLKIDEARMEPLHENGRADRSGSGGWPPRCWTSNRI